MGKFRKKEGLCLAEGEKIIRELKGSPWKIKTLLFWRDDYETDKGIRLDLPADTEIYRLTEREGKRLTQDDNPEGIMAVVAPPKEIDMNAASLAKTARLLLLHRINNPNNLGAVLRSAHWFGFSTVCLSGDSADYTNPKVVRASMGSLFHLQLRSECDFSALLPRLKETHHIVGSTPRGGNLPQRCPERTALLIGSESHGLPKNLLEMADELWTIPGGSNAESLSLPQAAAILMYACATSPREGS
ncbi:MAG: RNA methyltransferase [Smithellaceae bacterium]|nr:RNA methyltransferase [Smithellaceae bacterium]